MLGDHRVVGPPVGVLLGQRAAGHRQPQLRVVGRVGGDEVDRPVAQSAGEPARRPRPSRSPDGSKPRGPPGSAGRGRRAAARAPSRSPARRARRARRSRPSAARARSPARVAAPRQIAAPRSVPPTPANGSRTSSPALVKNSIRRAMSRGGLLAPCALRARVAELGGVGRGPDRLGEVEPLLAGELVEVVGRADGRPARAARSPSRGPARRAPGTPPIGSSARPAGGDRAAERPQAPGCHGRRGRRR